MASKPEGSDSCPEAANSTDCLLRYMISLLEDQRRSEDAEFNWDPITFGFTVTIAAVAAVFTFISILQALAAGGKGRRKSNQHAIGEWSTATRSQWSWRDMNRLSFATTPILRSDSIWDRSEVDERLAREEWKIMKDYGDPTATWVSFLRHVDLRKSFTRQYLHKITTADYLPDDIIAVPAYVDVGFVVTASAMAGVSSIQVDAVSQYPTVIGNGFQVDFRQHPSLGTVCAFSAYRGDRESPGKDVYFTKDTFGLRFNHVKRNMNGFLQFGRYSCWLLSNRLPRWRNEGFAMNHMNSFFSALKEAYGSYHHRTCTSTQSNGPEGAHDIYRNPICTSTLSNGPEDSYHFAWMLLAGAEELPEAFPASRAMRPKALHLMTLKSKFWSLPPRTLASMRAFPMLDTPKKFQLVEKMKPGHYIGPDEVERLEDEIRRRKGGDTSSKDMFNKETSNDDDQLPKPIAFFNFIFWTRTPLDTFFAFVAVFEACIKILQDHDDFIESFRVLDPSKKRLFRLLILFQMHEVETWFVKHIHDGRNVLCRVLELYRTTSALMGVDDAVRNGSFGFTIDESSAPPSKWNGLAQGFDTRDVTTRYFQTVQTLACFLDSFPKNDILQAVDDEDKREQVRRAAISAKVPLLHILGVSGDYDRLKDQISSVIPAVRGMMDVCYGVCETSPDEDAARDILGSRGEDDIIDDMLVWRSILLYILVVTAPDSTAFLQSGVRDHVVPMV